MKHTLEGDSISPDELNDRHRQDDPAFRDEWDRTAFGRDVAHAVIRYRAAQGLDVEQLATRLGVDAGRVETIEDGETDPDVRTLRLLAAHLGLRFTLDIHATTPSGAEVTYSVA